MGFTCTNLLKTEVNLLSNKMHKTVVFRKYFTTLLMLFLETSHLVKPIQ